MLQVTIKNPESFVNKHLAPLGLNPDAEYRLPKKGELYFDDNRTLVRANEDFRSVHCFVVSAKVPSFKDAVSLSAWQCPIAGAEEMSKYKDDPNFWVSYPGGFVAILPEFGPDIPEGVYGKCDLREGWAV